MRADNGNRPVWPARIHTDLDAACKLEDGSTAFRGMV